MPKRFTFLHGKLRRNGCEMSRLHTGPHVVEPVTMGTQAHFNITQTLTMSDLSESYAQKLMRHVKDLVKRLPS